MSKDWRANAGQGAQLTVTGKDVDVTTLAELKNKNQQSGLVRPKLIRTGANEYIVLFENWDNQKYQATYMMAVDDTGRVLASAQKIVEAPTQPIARLPRGDDAFNLRKAAAWVTGYGDSLVLHTVTKNAALLNYASTTYKLP